MPEEDVSDLSDVVDAINKLCDTMKTSYEVEDVISDINSGMDETEHTCYEYDAHVIASEYDLNILETHPCMEISDMDSSLMNEEIDASMAASDYEVNKLESECDSSTLVASENDSTMIASAIDTSMLASDIFSSMLASQNTSVSQEAESAQPLEYRNIEATIEEITIQKFQDVPERWSDAMSHISLQDTVTSDTLTGHCEVGSEVYYTASSEVSLLSDSELADKAQDEKDGYVIAGHVAAMRERFENMTRTSTPCPDFTRSLSPSHEMFRNTSPSPDRLA